MSVEEEVKTSSVTIALLTQIFAKAIYCLSMEIFWLYLDDIISVRKLVLRVLWSRVEEYQFESLPRPPQQKTDKL